MGSLLALVGFAFVSSVTPGPNNVLLSASGATFGFRQTLPHVIGTALGIGAMALAVGAGLGALVTAIPGLTLGMKVLGSAYLLFLAVQIARSGALEQGSVARPFTLVGAAAFQAVNPKAWIFALGAMSTFRPAELPPAAGVIAVAVTMMVVIMPTAAAWAAAGGVFSRLVSSPSSRRVVSSGLALLVAATVLSVWL